MLAVKVNRVKILVSILEESPIYSELKWDEKNLLIEELIKTYPYLFVGIDSP
jgi:hypothetical protein